MTATAEPKIPSKTLSELADEVEHEMEEELERVALQGVGEGLAEDAAGARHGELARARGGGEAQGGGEDVGRLQGHAGTSGLGEGRGRAPG